MSYIALVNLFNIKKNLSLPPLFRLTWNGIGWFGIDRERLHIGSKYGSRLVLSERTTGPPQVSYVSPSPHPKCREHVALVSHLLAWCALSSGDLVEEVAFSAAKRYSPLNRESTFQICPTLIKTDSSGKATSLIQRMEVDFF